MPLLPTSQIIVINDLVTPGVHEKVIEMTFYWEPGVKGLCSVYLFLI